MISKRHAAADCRGGRVTGGISCTEDIMSVDAPKERGFLYKRMREVSALAYTLALVALFMFQPGFSPMDVSTSPVAIMWFMCALSFGGLIYLVLQGYPLAHGYLGSASSHSSDAFFSFLPLLPVVVALVMHFATFWPLSDFVLMVAVMTVPFVVFDLWILGGVSSKLNRYIQQFKTEY